jgi:hypothetical protein
MYRKIGISIAVLTAMALTVSIVAAGNAHFVGNPQISTSGGTLTVSGKVAGLGNIDQIQVDITADAECVNRGNKNPSASNKTSLAFGDQVPVQNGKANFSLSGTASFSPDCSPPMRIEFSNVQIIVSDFETGEVLLTFPS